MTTQEPAGANLSALVLELAGQHPQRPAIVDRRGKVLRFGELAREAQRVAALLGEHGLPLGGRVLLLLPMGPELYVTLAALWSIGAVAVVVDPGAGLGHLRRCLKRVPLDGVVAVPLALPLLLVPELGRARVKVNLGPAFLGLLDWRRRPTLPPAPQPLALDESHPALITFTSGSTGVPKAVVRTHGFLRAQHRVLARHLRYDRHATDLATLPIVALASLASGRTVLLPDTSLKRPARIDAGRVLRQLAKHSAETVAGSPALLHTLAAGAVAQAQPLPFQRIYTGGGPVFPRTMRLLRQAAPDAELVAVYGSTEAEPIAHQAWREVSEGDLARTTQGQGLLVGPPVPELEVLIVPVTDGPLAYREGVQLRAAALPPFQPGEVLVSGPHVLPGYLDGVGDAETKWRDPASGQVWHRTGDAAQWDEQGRLWLLGRTSARVQDERGSLYPFAVEAAAMTHPTVKRAALLPGRRLLVIEADEDVEDDLRLSLAWAELDDVKRVPHIPVDTRHNAKVDYVKLKKLLGA